MRFLAPESDKLIIYNIGMCIFYDANNILKVSENYGRFSERWQLKQLLIGAANDREVRLYNENE